MRFDGLEWRGRRLKVEAIRDHPSYGRVRIPERLAEYVTGAAKKTKDGKVNELRRISRDDVDRLSRGQPSKKKGYGSRSVPHRLNDAERSELDRAAVKGFLVLSGNGNRRTRKGSPLANIHRQWCDARGKPQVIVYKAVLEGSSSGVVDQVLVDLSPLRLNGLFDDDSQLDEFMVRWKADIFTAAVNAGMTYRDYEESVEQDEEEEAEYIVTLDKASMKEAWATNPIWKLPVVSIGIFEGERSSAKAMAKALAELWDIPEEVKGEGATSRKAAGAKKGGRTKMKGISEQRKRGGGHRQLWMQ